MTELITSVAFDLAGSSSATFSHCGTYRYRLTRTWHEGLPPLVVGMLNPSTATHEESDPTVTRMRTRAERGGFGSLVVWNAFAFRATDPRDMKAAADPVGPDNDEMIRSILVDCLRRGGTAVVGWGVHGSFRDRDKAVLAIARDVGIQLHALAVTKEGQPGHPLYIELARPFTPWPPQL